jgi:predicted secreted protein
MLHSVMTKTGLITTSISLPIASLICFSTFNANAIATSKPKLFNTTNKSIIKPAIKPSIKTIVPAMVKLMSDHSLAQADQGKTITLKVGQSLTLRLNENPTTGYRWIIPTLENQIIQMVDDRFDRPVTHPNLMGAGGERIFVFQAKRAGTYHLTLENKQSWDLVTPAAESFSITVQITK